MAALRPRITILAMWAIAILALGADLAAHIAAIAGINPIDWFHPQWAAVVLFWAVFVLVALIAGAVDARRRRLAKIQSEIPPNNENPHWFKWILYPLVAYALFNAFYYGLIRGHPGELLQLKPGVYVIDPGHGRPFQSITETQYRQYRRNEARGATGFVLMFYLQIAFDMLCIALGINWQDPRPPRQIRTRWILTIWTRSEFKSR